MECCWGTSLCDSDILDMLFQGLGLALAHSPVQLTQRPNTISLCYPYPLSSGPPKLRGLKPLQNGIPPQQSDKSFVVPGLRADVMTFCQDKDTKFVQYFHFMHQSIKHVPTNQLERTHTLPCWRTHFDTWYLNGGGPSNFWQAGDLKHIFYWFLYLFLLILSAN